MADETRRLVEHCVVRMGFEDGLKPEQEKAILLFLQKRDVFVVLPTGYGKSLCYGCLPWVFDSIQEREGSVVIVISPLIALMKDQVQRFMSKGVSAVRVGDCSPEERQRIVEGEYQLVFISPEALLSQWKWRKMLTSKTYQEKLVALVVDEAHCVEKWGKDFRLEYSYLRELRSLVPATVNVMALTATASDSLISDIIRDIGMIDPAIVQVSPNRENLCFGTKEVTSVYDFMPLVMLLKKQRNSFKRTIIFCQRQIDCGLLFQLFVKEMGDELVDPIGAPFALPHYRLVDAFSKGTEDFVRDTILINCTQQSSVLRIIICTAAFGMGIDCADVSRVIHWGPTNDVETYIQQTGRSGRCGELSYCLMLHGKGLRRHCDKQILGYFQNTSQCRRSVLFRDFKSYVHGGNRCTCCDVCATKCQCSQCTNLLLNLSIL